jgi:hypothetical protein
MPYVLLACVRMDGYNHSMNKDNDWRRGRVTEIFRDSPTSFQALLSRAAVPIFHAM